MGLRDKIKETIEEFDWINDIDSKVEIETIDVLYNKPFYWYSPLSPDKWVSFQGMPKIFWLEDGIDSQEVKVCTHQHSKQDFYAKDCSPFFRSTVVKKFDRGVFVLQPQLTDINESKNDFGWVEDVVPEEYKFFTVYVDDGIVGGSYFIKVPNLKNLEYDLDDCCPIDIPVTKEEAEDFLDWSTSEKEIEDRDYEYIQHVRQISREEYCRAFGNYRDEDKNNMNICGKNKETISENNDFNWIEDTNPKELKSPYDFILEYFTKNTNNTYKGYEYGLDNFMGTVEWVPTKEGMLDFYIYATPFWGEAYSLPIDAVDADGNHESLVEIEVPKFKYEMELVDWLENEYPKIVYKQIEEFSSEVITENTPSTQLTDDELRNIAKKFTSRSEWKRKSQSTWRRAKNRDKEIPGFFDDITSDMDVLRKKISDDELRDIAKEFETRTEWYRKSPNSYRQAIRRDKEIPGFYNDITSDMKRLEVSEKYIYAYEFYDGGKPIAAYIGLTCDMKRRSKEHETGFCRYGKSESTVTKYIKNNPKLKYKIVELESEPLKGEKAKAKEKYWEKVYSERGWETLNVAKTGALGLTYISTNDELRGIAKKYETKGEWKNSIDGNAYRSALSRGKDFYDDITSHMVSGKSRSTDGKFKSKN